MEILSTTPPSPALNDLLRWQEARQKQEREEKDLQEQEAWAKIKELPATLLGNAWKEILPYCTKEGVFDSSYLWEIILPETTPFLIAANVGCNLRIGVARTPNLTSTAMWEPHRAESVPALQDLAKVILDRRADYVKCVELARKSHAEENLRKARLLAKSLINRHSSHFPTNESAAKAIIAEIETLVGDGWDDIAESPFAEDMESADTLLKAWQNENMLRECAEEETRQGRLQQEAKVRAYELALDQYRVDYTRYLRECVLVLNANTLKAAHLAKEWSAPLTVYQLTYAVHDCTEGEASVVEHETLFAIYAFPQGGFYQAIQNRCVVRTLLPTVFKVVEVSLSPSDIPGNPLLRDCPLWSQSWHYPPTLSQEQAQERYRALFLEPLPARPVKPDLLEWDDHATAVQEAISSVCDTMEDAEDKPITQEHLARF